MTEFRLSAAQWARPGLLAGLAELAALGAEADGDAAEAAAWLSAQIDDLPCVRRRRRDKAIVALRSELCAMQSDNRAADVISASLRRFADRLRRESGAECSPTHLAAPATAIDRLRRDVIEAANGKLPGKRSIRAILAAARALANRKPLHLPTDSRNIAQ